MDKSKTPEEHVSEIATNKNITTDKVVKVNRRVQKLQRMANKRSFFSYMILEERLEFLLKQIQMETASRPPFNKLRDVGSRFWNRAYK